MIDFVDDEENGGFGFAELLSKSQIDGGEAFVGIDNEKDDVASGDGDIHLKGDLFGKAIIEGRADAAGIDDIAGDGSGFARRRDPVTGDARLIVDDGDFSPCEAIEDGRFPDVRAANDGDGRHGREYEPFAHDNQERNFLW